MALRVKLLRDGARVPTVGHPGEDLGYDLYALFPIDEELGVRRYTVIQPHTVESIPTGVAIEFQPKAGGLVLTRSSMAKKGIITVGGVVDAGYRGECIVMLANLTNEPYTVSHGDKIAQLVQFPFIAGEASPVADLSESVRKQFGWGSTGK